jgi:hypothetical protein
LTSNVVSTGQDVKGRKMWRNRNREREEKDVQIERQTDKKTDRQTHSKRR